MAKFNLSTNHAANVNGNRFSVVFHLTGKPDPFPQRQIEARKPADALAELEAYKAEVAAAVGEPVAVSLRLAKGERAPNGWKAAEKASPFYHLVHPAAVEG